MRRGEIWTVSGGPEYLGKARPVVILQDDRFDATASVTVCAFTTDPTDAPLFRLPVEPTDGNGLRRSSRLMVDKVTTVPRSKLGARLGRLDEATIVRTNRALMVFLGMGDRPRNNRRASGRGNAAPC